MEEQRIKRLRRGLGLSQERFARLMGVSLQTVHRWEAGLNRPLPLIAVRLEELRRELAARETHEGGGAVSQKRPEGPGEDARFEVSVGGLGGLFKGLGGLLEVVSKMAAEGTQETRGGGVRSVLGGKGRAVYGFSVRMGLDGAPRFESFGNVRTAETGPEVTEAREPLMDVFDEDHEVRVVAEVPGVEEGDIRVEVHDDVLTLAAEGRERRYEKELLLPAAVEPEYQRSYLNGVLELRFTKR